MVGSFTINDNCAKKIKNKRFFEENFCFILLA